MQGMCGGLTLAGKCVPTKPLYHSASSTRKGRENTTKGSGVEVRTKQAQVREINSSKILVTMDHKIKNHRIPES